MSTSDQRLFSARMTMLRETAAFVRAFCDRHGIVHDDAMRLTLIIEELFTNSVEHGYRGECDAPIRIALTINLDGIAVLYEDSAPRYDPLAALTRPPESMTQNVESRPVGGLGVYIVGQLVDSPSYAFEESCNRLRLTLPVAR